MAARLTDAHIAAQARLRDRVQVAVERVWRAMPDYDRPTVDSWLAAILPVVEAAQRASVALTQSYVATMLDTGPAKVDPADVVASVRGDVEPRDVYQRPFVTVWTELSNGALYADAVERGLQRAKVLATTDVQLAMRAACGVIQDG